ncbi:hypothetical protein M885DRAFT_510476 [Pelagophyceae sp. CCMP2097]|nr:hypothetical protein M885DRAFT_510476 [Pelagophyceae sp. CCMP2097]
MRPTVTLVLACLWAAEAFVLPQRIAPTMHAAEGGKEESKRRKRRKTVEAPAPESAPAVEPVDYDAPREDVDDDAEVVELPWSFAKAPTRMSEGDFNLKEAGDAGIPKLDPRLDAFIVDEPGNSLLPTRESVDKKRGESIDKKRRKEDAILKAETEKMSLEGNFKALRERAAKLGGKAPQDPTDAFDYGIGGLVKKSVYATAAILVAWEIYLNSPAFERAAPPPLVQGYARELEQEQADEARSLAQEARKALEQAAKDAKYDASYDGTYK